MNNTNADSLERKKYHEIITKILPLFDINSIIYDVGKSHKYNYSSIFKNSNYKSIDISTGKCPDILLNFEDTEEVLKLPKADLILCNGVVEQCNNPFEIIKNCLLLLNDRGYLLFGSVLTGFPVYENDYFRFTANGLRRMFKNIVTEEIIYREGITFPTYMYILSRGN